MNISYPLLAVILAALNAIGPFSIDTYLPAFPAIEQSLGTTTLSVQQSLTAYMLPFSLMMLWHGALSDALGRRRVILFGMSCYLAASLLCAFAQNIEMLWLGRALQGLSAGSGVIVGRAIVRDLLDGPAAQRLMSHVAVVFAIAPGVAPIIGGVLAEAFGWRAIFALLAIMAAALMALVWTQLPETLPADKRQSLHPVDLLRAYAGVLGDARFVLLSLAMASLFGGFFIYVMSAPVFLMQHLHLDATQFGWLFVPLVLGMMGGSLLSARLAGRLSPMATVKLGYAIATAATLLNVLLSVLLPDTLALRIPQLALYTLGMSAAMPTLTLHALDMFPQRRGLAASCQGAIQTLVMAFAAGVIAPLVWGTTLHLALAGAGSLLLSALACRFGTRARPAA